MKQPCFVGFDTSNYTTSAAVVTAAGDVVANLKAPLPVKEGERGLRQSDAVFSHVRNLPSLMARLREVLTDYEVQAVGFSEKPRDAEDSYMPCFLTGVAAAHAFAAALPSSVPLYAFSHQDGHVMAAAYASGYPALRETPFAAFHVSGGTTEVLYVTCEGDRLRVSRIGGTDDLNAGQLIDRTGVKLGLSFPCGPALETLAAGNTRPLPPIRPSVTGLVCHLSGAENLADALYRDTQDKACVAAFVLAYVGQTLDRLTEEVRKTYGMCPVLYAGGVMSNRQIRALLSRRPETYFAEPSFAADNAAGIAMLCRMRHGAG